MKITSSLKLSFFIAMVLFGLSTALVFSTLGLNYFFSGLDMGVNQGMRFALRSLPELPKNVVSHSNGFDITYDWDLLPEELTGTLSKPETFGVLEKEAINDFFLSPPEKVLLAMVLRDINQQPVYIATTLDKHKVPKRAEHQFIHPGWIIVMGIVVFFLFVLLTLVYIRWVTHPVQALRDWARALDNQSLGDEVPSFKYRELDGLAAIIHQSMLSVQESVNREQQFLSHASHELRTPIAVTRTNSELLSKVMQREGASDKQQAILDRIIRANKTMTDLTDTLLWLSRESDNLPESQAVDLGALLVELTAEVDYLLQGKQVEVSVKTAPFTVNAAPIPCRIALLNLIRNAYQHTVEGHVVIEQRAGEVVIINSVSDEEGESEELGFGLGLKLTKKIADVYAWTYTGSRNKESYQATLTFPHSQ